MARPRKLYHYTKMDALEAFESGDNEVIDDIDKLAEKITKEFSRYTDAALHIIMQIGRSVGNEAIEMLEAISPEDTGEYADAWKIDFKTKPDQPVMLIIHNNKYQLTHLLEFGHASVMGGRVDGQPHISTVQDFVNEEFEARIVRALGEY